MPRSALALVLLAAALPGSATAAGDRVIGPVGGAVGPASAWHGHVVFSARDPATGRWALLHATTAGIAALPVAPQPVPLVADVGSDARGRPVAVYSRCDHPLSRTGCHVRLMALGARPGPERLVRSLFSTGFDDVAPSIRAGRIAFGRRRAGGPRIASLYVQRRAGARGLMPLARGTVPACRGVARCSRTAMPTQTDLGAGALAVLWSLSGGNAFPQVDDEVWRIPLSGRPGRLLDVGGAGECGFGGDSFRGFASPAAAAGRVTYLRTGGDCRVEHSAFTEAGPGWRERREHVPAAPALAYAMARDGAARYWWVRGAAVGPEQADAPCGVAACSLVLSSGVPLRRVAVPRQPWPPLSCPGRVGGLCGKPPRSTGPDSPRALRRYLAARMAVFRGPRRSRDVLPARLRAALRLDAGSYAGSRFLAAVARHAAYVLPQNPSGVCVVVGARPPARVCSSARDLMVGLGANVVPGIALPRGRRLVVAVLPDGARHVAYRSGGRVVRVTPYRNFAGRVLPGRPGTGRWTLEWTRSGRHHAVAVE